MWINKTLLIQLMIRKKVTRKEAAKSMGYNAKNSADRYLKDPKLLNDHQKKRLARRLTVTIEQLNIIINSKPNSNLDKILNDEKTIHID